MIQCNNVTKSYLGNHEALSRVSFQLEEGEMVFLTGHSGAGKSTLLKLLTLIERPTSGEIIIHGHTTNRLKGWHYSMLRRSMGIISQNPRLIMERTVFDNVALPLVVSGYRHQEIVRRVRAALDKVALLNKEKVISMALSSGEQQRVSIARAVVTKPPLLIADEPTGNLDPKLSSEIMALFSEFNQVGVSVLIATHDLNLIAKMKYRIMVLKQGRLMSDG